MRPKVLGGPTGARYLPRIMIMGLGVSETDRVNTRRALPDGFHHARSGAGRGFPVKSRVVGAFVLLGLAACADKTPPAQRPQATAPLTTPVATGVASGPPIEFVAADAAR